MAALLILVPWQVAEEIAADFGVDIGLGAIKLEIGAIRLQCIVADCH